MKQLKNQSAERVSQLEEELLEKEEEKELTQVKMEYFRNLVEQKDQEIQTLRSQYEVFRQDLLRQKELLEE